MMTSRERVLAALERREPDRVPTLDMMYELGNINKILGRRLVLPTGLPFKNHFLARLTDLIVPHVNTDLVMNKAMEDFAHDLVASAVKLGYDAVWVMHSPTFRFSDSRSTYDIYGRSFDVQVDEKGNFLTPMYREGLIGGRGDWDALDKKQIFRMPALTYSALSKISKEFNDRIFIFGSFHGGLFEITWQCMGFERFILASRREKEFVKRMIQFYADYYCLMVEAIAAAGLPGVLYPDDLAFRSGPMLNPRLLEELYGDAYRRITSTAHALGMKVVMHTCGNVYALLDWLADCGFDGVHGLEPTAGVELAKAKEAIGDRLCLVGNIDVTHILMDASKEEVFEAVRVAIGDAAAGGGYIVAQTNTHPKISVQRLEWMLEAVEQYGGYAPS
ncbi:MAG TPA: uroporphyrinogen decarboxylase family protein [Candidatus Anoxymicrobiaceae bacterium]